MKETGWIEFKSISEKKFKNVTIQQCWGFQIQKDTKWNEGLSVSEIEKLEEKFGFKFPIYYYEIHGYKMPQLEGMLNLFNGVSSTHEKLKLPKPSGVENKNLDVYFNYNHP